MIDGHRLYQSSIDGRGGEPSDAFAIEVASGAVLALIGELDMAAAPAVRSRVESASGANGVLLDLTEATFVDLSMLKELRRAHAELEGADRRLVLAGVPVAVQRLFELTGTAELFTLAKDRESGLRLLNGR